MSTGLQAQPNSRLLTFRILSARTTTNSPPSGSSAGLAFSDLDGTIGAATPIARSFLRVYSTAGSGVMTVTIRMWGYDGVAAHWFPYGSGSDAGKGVINEGNAIGESIADLLLHEETFFYATAFDRIYAEVSAIGGTSTAVTVDLVFETASVSS